MILFVIVFFILFERSELAHLPRKYFTRGNHKSQAKELMWIPDYPSRQQVHKTGHRHVNKQRMGHSRIHHKIPPTSYKHFKYWLKADRPLKQTKRRHRLTQKQLSKSETKHQASHSKSGFQLASHVHSISRNEALRNTRRNSGHVYMKHKAENLRTKLMSKHPNFVSNHNVLKSKIKSRNVTQSSANDEIPDGMFEMYDDSEDYNQDSKKSSIAPINKNKDMIPSLSTVSSSSFNPDFFIARVTDTSFIKDSKQKGIFQMPLPFHSTTSLHTSMSEEDKTRFPFIMVPLTTTKPFQESPFMESTDKLQPFVLGNGGLKLFENKKAEMHIPIFTSTDPSKSNIFNPHHLVLVNKSGNVPFALFPSPRNHQQINETSLSVPAMNNMFKEFIPFIYTSESSRISENFGRKPAIGQAVEHRVSPEMDFGKIPSDAHIKSNMEQAQHAFFPSHNKSNIFLFEPVPFDEKFKTSHPVTPFPGGNDQLPVWFLQRKPILSGGQDNSSLINTPVNPEVVGLPSTKVKLPKYPAMFGMEKGRIPVMGPMAPVINDSIYKFPFNINDASEKNNLKQLTNKYEEGITETNTTVPSAFKNAHNKLKGIMVSKKNKIFLFSILMLLVSLLLIFGVLFYYKYFEKKIRKKYPFKKKNKFTFSRVSKKQKKELIKRIGRASLRKYDPLKTEDTLNSAEINFAEGF